MKKLSKRIGAILTMAAMLAALMPVAMPVMAAGENLIENGTFGTNNSDKNLECWTVVGDTTKVSAYYKTTGQGSKLTGPSVRIVGKQGENGVEQNVALGTDAAEKSYKLTFDAIANTSSNPGVRVTLTYGTYDGTTFTSISSSSGSTLRMLLSGSGVTESISVNFNLPATADAVKVTLTAENGGSSDTVTNIDNITLTECSDQIEMVNNGELKALADNSAAAGWTRNTSGELANKSSFENGYAKFTGHHNDVLYFRNALTMRHSKVYELSFKFAQCGFEDGVAPNVLLDIDSSDVTAAFAKAPASSSADELAWQEYKTLVTVDKPDTSDADLVDAVMTLHSVGTEATWPEGAAVYYDDISLIEVNDVDTQMFFSIGANGIAAEAAEAAKTASCIFVQGDTDYAASKFIVAKYNSATNALEGVVAMENAGAELKANGAKRYNVSLDSYDATYYYRIFLWDGTTLKPVLNSEKIG